MKQIIMTWVVLKEGTTSGILVVCLLISQMPDTNLPFHITQKAFIVPTVSIEHVI